MYGHRYDGYSGVFLFLKVVQSNPELNFIVLISQNSLVFNNNLCFNQNNNVSDSLK